MFTSELHRNIGIYTMVDIMSTEGCTDERPGL